MVNHFAMKPRAVLHSAHAEKNARGQTQMALLPMRIIKTDPLPEGLMASIPTGNGKSWSYPRGDGLYIGVQSGVRHGRPFAMTRLAGPNFR